MAGFSERRFAYNNNCETNLQAELTYKYTASRTGADYNVRRLAISWQLGREGAGAKAARKHVVPKAACDHLACPRPHRQSTTRRPCWDHANSVRSVVQYVDMRDCTLNESAIAQEAN